jgi:hypothetical protein
MDMEKTNRAEFFKRPAVFHGLLTGMLILAAKFVFYVSHHWEYVHSASFPYLTFLLMVISIFMAANSEKKIFGATFTYWKAFLSGLIVISVAVIISLLADQVLYRIIDTTLKEQTIAIQMEMFQEGVGKIKEISNANKDMMIEEIKKSDPSSLYSFFMGIFVKIFFNALFLLIIALFTRQKVDRNQWLNE